MPTTWFLRNHLLACAKTHSRGQKCVSMQGTHRWRQHRNRKKSSRIYMTNWKTLMFDVRMDADMMGINRWKSAPGRINFSYELLSQTQNSASWKIHRWWSTHDRCEMRFVRFNLEFILKRDMRSVNWSTFKTKKGPRSAATVRFSFDHDEAKSAIIGKRKSSFCTSRGRQCDFEMSPALYLKF